MRNVPIIFLLLVSNLISGQERFDNEKQIESIENYNVEEIVAKVEKTVTVYGTFKETIELYGTLLTPKTDFEKIIVIISGTGKISQKAHNYLTEYLLENNIGVFRFDKRGVGKSTGKYSDFYQIYTNDFVNIFKELKKANSLLNKKIGFLGHSLGGIVSIEVIKNEFKPDFLIQWSAPINKPRDLMKYQMRNGITNYNNQILGNNIEERIKIIDFVNQIIDENPEKNAWELRKIAKKESKKNGIKKKAYGNYLRTNNVEFARINNTKTYSDIDFPTLVIIGKEDILVDPKQNKAALDRIGNKNISFKEIEDLNHFMVKKGTNQKTNEIYDVEQVFKDYLIDWINKLKK